MVVTESSGCVREVMSTPVLTAYVDESLWEAWQLLSVAGLRHLAVLRADGTCLGVLNDRSVLGAGPDPVGRLQANRISDVMALVPDVHITPTTPVWMAAEMMVDRTIEALTVLDEGRLVGIVTESDLVRWVAKQGRELAS